MESNKYKGLRKILETIADIKISRRLLHCQDRMDVWWAQVRIHAVVINFIYKAGTF